MWLCRPHRRNRPLRVWPLLVFAVAIVLGLAALSPQDSGAHPHQTAAGVVFVEGVELSNLGASTCRGHPTPDEWLPPAWAAGDPELVELMRRAYRYEYYMQPVKGESDPNSVVAHGRVGLEAAYGFPQGH